MLTRARVLTLLLLLGCKEGAVRETDVRVKVYIEWIDELLREPLSRQPSGLENGLNNALWTWRRRFEVPCRVVDLLEAPSVVHDAKLRETYVRRCNRDRYVGVLRRVVEVVESARRVAPDRVLPECTSASWYSALDELARLKTADEESRAFEARFAAACPKS